MAPEYGATMGFFPIDEETVNYLRATGRADNHCAVYENYHRAQGLFGIPGEGEIDRTFVVRRLEDFGYDGVLSVELEDHYFQNTPELQQEGLLRSKDHIESIVKER